MIAQAGDCIPSLVWGMGRGLMIDIKDVQKENTGLPIISTGSGIITSFNDAHPLKQNLRIFLTDSKISNGINKEHFSKENRILSTVFGICIHLLK